MQAVNRSRWVQRLDEPLPSPILRQQRQATVAGEREAHRGRRASPVCEAVDRGPATGGTPLGGHEVNWFMDSDHGTLTTPKRATEPRRGPNTARLAVLSRRMLTQPRRMPSQSRRAIPQSRRMLTQPRRPLLQTRRSVPQPRRMVIQPRRTLSQARRIDPQTRRVFTDPSGMGVDGSR